MVSLPAFGWQYIAADPAGFFIPRPRLASNISISGVVNTTDTAWIIDAIDDTDLNSLFRVFPHWQVFENKSIKSPKTAYDDYHYKKYRDNPNPGSLHDTRHLDIQFLTTQHIEPPEFSGTLTINLSMGTNLLSMQEKN